MSLKSRRLWVFLLLALGEMLWLTLSTKDVPHPAHYALLAGVIVAALIPKVRDAFCALARAADRRLADDRSARRAAIVVGVAATVYLYCTGVFTVGRELYPRVHDEHSYLLQMQMLARGELWITPPPDWPADFFETFHTLVKPVYASSYFPGTAVLYVPAVWLGLPFWVLPLLASGAIVGLTFWIVVKLIDGSSGLLAALLMVSLSRFRWLSLRVMSYNAMLLIGLLMFVCYLRWRRERNWKWALPIGALAGWGAVTRPIDAICFAAPIGVMMLLDLLRPEKISVQPGSRGRPAAITAGMLVLGATPFLALQLAFNVGVTGKLTGTPYNYNADRFYPQVSFGFHAYDPNLKPQTSLAQKYYFHERFNVREIKRHRPGTILRSWGDERCRELLHATLPHPVLYMLVPVGFIGLIDRRRVALAGVLPCFVVLYSFFAFFMSQYAAAVMPSVILLVLLGGRAIRDAFPGHRGFVAALLGGLIVVFSAANLNEFSPLPSADDEGDFRALRFANLELPLQVKTPAVVLFTFHPTDNVHDEPVFNVTTAWPDDAAVVRAHDLGDRNAELFRYYAGHQPDRSVYRVDRSTLELKFLGVAKDLADAAK